MFVIEVIYTAPLEKIDAHMKAHVQYLEKHYDAGTFVVSGRKVPRDGGIIIANGTDKAELEAIVKEDPFIAKGLAEYRIVQFRASQRAADVPKRLE